MRKDGQPCQAWATIYSEPPRCASHVTKGEKAVDCSANSAPLKGLQLLIYLLQEEGVES